MERPTIPQLLAFFAVLLVYVAARIWSMSTSCLWFDEIFSVHAAEHSWSGLINFVALDLIHPPLFYIALKIWIAIGGESLFWLRLLPAVFSIIAIVPFFLLCRELRIETWPTVFALFLVAVNGSMIKYAQEVRMYSMLMCLSLFSMWLFARFLRTGNGIVFLTVVNILLIYSHYFGWLVISAEIMSIAIVNRERLNVFATSLAITAAAFGPWAVAVLQAPSLGFGLEQNIGWMTRPGTIELATTGLSLVEPFYFRLTSIEPLSLYPLSVPIVVIALVCISIYLVKHKAALISRTQIFLPLVFFGVPMIIAFGASWILPYSVWGTRHLIIVFAPFAIMFASAIFGHSLTRVIGLPLILTLSAAEFAVAVTRDNPRPIWCGYETVAQEIGSNGPRTIYVFEDLAAYHLWFTLRDRPDPPSIIKVNGFAAMPEDPSYFLPRGFNGVSFQIYESVEWPDDFWMVYRSQAYDTNSEPLRSVVERGYSITDELIDDFGYAKQIAVRLTRRSQP